MATISDLDAAVTSVTNAANSIIAKVDTLTSDNTAKDVQIASLKATEAGLQAEIDRLHAVANSITVKLV